MWPVALYIFTKPVDDRVYIHKLHFVQIYTQASTSEVQNIQVGRPFPCPFSFGAGNMILTD